MTPAVPFTAPSAGRGFRSYASLKHHIAEHRQPSHCRNCGKPLREGEYHRC
jgi:hypothetical protein